MVIVGLILGVVAVVYLTIVTKRYLHQNKIDLEDAPPIIGEKMGED